MHDGTFFHFAESKHHIYTLFDIYRDAFYSLHLWKTSHNMSWEKVLRLSVNLAFSFGQKNTLHCTGLLEKANSL